MGAVTIHVEYDTKYRQRQKIMAFINKLSANLPQLLLEIRKETAPEAQDVALEIASTAVDRFYGDYTPNGYGRLGDLYNAYRVSINSDYTINFELGADLMQASHHQSNSYIYNMAMIEGRHGGAPLWRWPYGIWSYWYPQTVPVSDSPYEEIKNEWETYVNGAYLETKIYVIKRLIKQYLRKELNVIG